MILHGELLMVSDLYGPPFLNRLANFTVGVIETDFPDIWSKTVVHSETAGSMLFIPRERNMTRLYIELHPNTTQPVAAEIANEEFVMRRAAEILHPFHIKWKSIGRHLIS